MSSRRRFDAHQCQHAYAKHQPIDAFMESALGKNKDHDTQVALDALIGENLIDDVLGVVKSGKEATVYCCEKDGGLVAAKVYRTTDVRRFSNDAQYRTGRRHHTNRSGGAILGSRGERAMEAKSRRGREFAFDAWVSAEYETLELLHAARPPGHRRGAPHL
jgi:RIO kinase 1